MISQVPAILWTTDRDLRITSSAGAGLAALGQVPNDSVGRRLQERLGTEDPAFLPLAAHLGVLKGEPARYEMEWKGRYFRTSIDPLRDADGTITGCIGLALDVTEHRQSFETTRQLAAIVESADDAIIGTTVDGIINTWNPGAEKLYGWSAAEAIGRHITLVVPAGHEDQITRQIDELREGRGIRRETRRRRKDGSLVDVSLNVTPVRDDQGRIVAFAGIARDISAPKRSEEVTRRRTRQLQRQQTAILDLARTPTEDLESALHHITETAARTMNVERVSVWFYDGERSKIVCADLHLLSKKSHDKGTELAARDYPRYFQALENSRIIPAHRADSDTRTAEFTEGYLKPLGISSMMDVAVRLHGRVVGVLCHEQVGAAREWTLEEQEFASSLADQVSLALETADRRRAEEEVHLLEDLLLAISAARDVESALATTLRMVCETSHWILGQAWIPAAGDGGERLVCSPACFMRDPTLQPFRTLSENTLFPQGRGLPGRVWMSRQPAWIRDVTRDDNFPRKPVAEQVGLKAGLGVPVVAGDRVIAVLEFFLREPRPEDERFVAVVGATAAQLGALIQRKQAEEALRASEAKFRILFANNPHPMWVFDQETLRFLEVNDSAIRHYGYPRDEFLAMRITDIRPAEDVPRLLDHLRHSRRDMQSAGVWRHRLKSGKMIEVEIISHSLEFAGRPAILTVAQDVTERRLLEAELRHAQKMEAVGRLAGGVAHDINNVLMVIKGYSAFLLDRLPDGDPLRNDVDEIRKAGERAAWFTRRLLAFSRRQVMAPEVIDLNSLVANLDKMIRRLIGEDIELVIHAADALGRVKADPGQVEQVIMNLLVNSRDAMPEGGRITIGTANADVDAAGAQRIPGLVPGEYVTLSVVDSGTGMDAEVLSHLFEPFFTTKEPGKGTGLGLATVYGIIRQMGGHVEVQSEPGRGATFRLYLPRVSEEVVPVAPLKPIPPLAQGVETVLLVEDEETVRTLVRKILGRSGYEVLEARNGTEALVLAKRHAGTIDLMVTDVVMPQMSGRELAVRMEDLRPGLKVLYMSGYTEHAIVQEGLADPSLAFLQKPFTPDEFARKVREVLDRGRSPVKP